MREPIKFGDYYLFERVAVGGMAEVFKGVSYGVEGFERMFAVKRVLPNIAEDQEFVEMFIDEAKIAVQLTHANIGQIFELGKVDGSYFIAMEFVEGRDLRAIWDRARQEGRPLDPAMCCHIVKEVCEALEYAHNKKRNNGEDLDLIHRDVSPQNIIVSYDGEVKLIDFGIAKAAGKASKTQAGILKGKFGYMSPEQVRGKQIDRRTDLFSLAAVLFELLTLERCFQGESDFSTLDKVRNVDIRQPSELNRDIPPQLERIILKGLTQNPEARFQTAAEFQDALQKYLYQSGEFYTRKDLSAFMRGSFDTELQRSHSRLGAFREYASQNIREARRNSPTPEDDGESTVDEPADFKPALPNLSWEDEEVATAVWDRSPSQILAEVDLSREKHRPAVPPEPAFVQPAPLDSAPTIQDDGRHQHMVPTVTAIEAVDSSSGRWRIWALLLIALVAIGASVFFVYQQRRGGTVTFETTPATITVRVDDAAAQTLQSPVTLADLAPGAHRIRMQAPGFQNGEHTVTIQAGQTVELPPVALAPIPTGLHIDTQPGGAKVYIDDVYVDDTPLRAEKLSPGVRSLRIELAGYLPWKGTVEAAEGTIRRVETIALIPAEVSVRFMPEPEEAALTLVHPDGRREALGTGSIKRQLPNQGTLKLEASLAGYATTSVAIPQYKAKDGNAIDLVLKRTGAAPPRAPTTKAPPVRRPTPTRKPTVTRRPRPVDEDAPDAPPAVKPPPKRVVVKRPPRRPATKAPPPKPKGFGFLNLVAKPPAQAFIGGRPVGWTPLFKHKLPAGSHRIELVREGAGGYRRTISVVIDADKTTLRKFRP